MTENSSVKKAARRRKEATGEKYTEALRAVLAERQGGGGSTGPSSVGLKLEPETLTAVIGGGGLTNLALVMPWVVGSAEAGHRVVVAANEGKLEAWGMASPFDFLVAGGKVSAEDLAELWISEDEADRKRLLALVEGAYPSISFAAGPRAADEWVSALTASPAGGKPSILLVPEIQVDRAVSDWPPAQASAGVSDFELLPTQATGLRSIARQAKAIVIVCHCAGIGEDGGPGMLGQIADESVVLVDDLWDSEQRNVPATLRFHSRWAAGAEPTHTGSARIETGFAEWRNLAVTAQRAV